MHLHITTEISSEPSPEEAIVDGMAVSPTEDLKLYHEQIVWVLDIDISTSDQRPKKNHLYSDVPTCVAFPILEALGDA